MATVNNFNDEQPILRFKFRLLDAWWESSYLRLRHSAWLLSSGDCIVTSVPLFPRRTLKDPPPENPPACRCSFPLRSCVISCMLPATYSHWGLWKLMLLSRKWVERQREDPVTSYDWLHRSTCQSPQWGLLASLIPDGRCGPLLLITWDSIKSVLSLISFGSVEIFLGNYCLSSENVLVGKQALEIQKAFWGTLISHWRSLHLKAKWVWKRLLGNFFWASFSRLQILCEGLKCSFGVFTLYSGRLIARNHGCCSLSRLFELLSELIVAGLVHIRCIFIEQRGCIS